MAVKRDENFWRGIVAAAADIKSSVITNMSPPGFREAIGHHVWYQVRLGELVLCHNGEWIFIDRKDSIKKRLKYAHKTAHEALDALRAAVAPDEPACAVIIDAVYKRSS